MIFDILFYSALFICTIGTFYKVVVWIKKSVGYENHLLPSHRFSSLIKGLISTIFSLRFIHLIQSLFIDVLFQKRILKTSTLRWGMHLLIFIGFIGLVFMHAFDAVFTEKLFPYYYSTVNPFFFLRNLFGLMVLTGIGIAIYRRYYLKPARIKNAPSDLFAILIILAIIVSGILLEGLKMASVSEFTVMVEDYAGLDYEDEDTLALETYWVKEYALVSSRVKAPFGNQVLALGLEVHETNCMDCHSPNKSAFLGYAAAKLMSPFAILLDKINGVPILYYVHILACFLGLALVPFSKMFHMISTPISLLTNAVQNKDKLFNENMMTKQLMELDACTHCSTCNLNCSAGMMYESIKNDYILPSEKIQMLKKVVSKDQLNEKEFKTLFQGLYICTNCDRCTVVCPSGIDLKSLWLSVREKLLAQSPDMPFILSAFSFVRGLNPMNVKTRDYKAPINKAFKTTTSVINKTEPLTIGIRENETNFTIDLPPVNTFSHCFGCQNCSTICPVVASFEAPEEDLIMMPHQIMYSLGLGLVDMAKDSAMIWNCLSCYQCQENCPQNVTVCDILFQLKNKTFQNFQDKGQ
ncbi:MAG: 4Fe-4S dicluster domain-containing protein [Desulfobacteraceae bacterium]|nr:4Fe-4S dicluster domain-containing protein [Desulfobacteraceae bacterium]